jgi:hypothetical protein
VWVKTKNRATARFARSGTAWSASAWRVHGRRQCGVSIEFVPRVHVVEQSTASAERVLEAARDFSERRAEMWPDVHVEHLQLHEAGDAWAEVTEGNPWPIGYVWERLRYDWSEPGSIKGTVVDSNIFKPGSTWELRATPANGGSRVEVIGVRHLRGRGRALAPVFPLGLAARTVAEHLRHFLSVVEQGSPGAGETVRTRVE